MVAHTSIENSLTEWRNLDYRADNKEKIVGRCRHSTVVYGSKIVTFAGCFKYNRKR